MALIRLCPSRPHNYEVRRQKAKRSEIIHVKDLKRYLEPIAWGDEDVASVEEGVGENTTKKCEAKESESKNKAQDATGASATVAPEANQESGIIAFLFGTATDESLQQLSKRLETLGSETTGFVHVLAEQASSLIRPY